MVSWERGRGEMERVGELGGGGGGRSRARWLATMLRGSGMVLGGRRSKLGGEGREERY